VSIGDDISHRVHDEALGGKREAFDFASEDVGVDEGAGPENAERLGKKGGGWKVPEHMADSIVVVSRVARVRPTDSDDDLGVEIAGEEERSLPFAFGAELAADDHRCGHRYGGSS